MHTLSEKKKIESLLTISTCMNLGFIQFSWMFSFWTFPFKWYHPHVIIIPANPINFMACVCIEKRELESCSLSLITDSLFSMTFNTNFSWWLRQLTLKLFGQIAFMGSVTMRYSWDTYVGYCPADCLEGANCFWLLLYFSPLSFPQSFIILKFFSP